MKSKLLHFTEDEVVTIVFSLGYVSCQEHGEEYNEIFDDISRLYSIMRPDMMLTENEKDVLLYSLQCTHSDYNSHSDVAMAILAILNKHFPQREKGCELNELPLN